MCPWLPFLIITSATAAAVAVIVTITVLVGHIGTIDVNPALLSVRSLPTHRLGRQRMNENRCFTYRAREIGSAGVVIEVVGSHHARRGGMMMVMIQFIVKPLVNASGMKRVTARIEYA